MENDWVFMWSTFWQLPFRLFRINVEVERGRRTRDFLVDEIIKNHLDYFLEEVIFVSNYYLTKKWIKYMIMLRAS